MRQLKQDNFKIQTLNFEQMSYGNPGTKYCYFHSQNKATLLCFSFYEGNVSVEIPIKNTTKIDELVYDTIKHWKRNYKPVFDICDGLYWSLEIELQDRTKYKFKGYYETPENFEDLQTLFDTIITTLKAIE